MVGSERILLVEDDQNQVRLIEHVFRQGRVSNPVCAVTSAEDAMSYLSGTGKYSDRDEYPFPCLLLLDLKLPGASGFDLLNWVRANPKFQRLPVVVLTNSTNNSDIDRAYSLGANSYLTKPVELDGFRAVVKAINAYWIILAEKPKI
jgi:CheY-like chemotaxis protein